MKARPNSNYILSVMRDDDIAYDPWGTAMSWAFACAEVLTVVGADVPSELGYQPSPYVVIQSMDEFMPESYPDDVVFEYLRDASDLQAAIKDVQTAAKCLHLYIHLCREAGRDY